ncbi:MAG: hypothetical protein JNL62_01970 [Bryobacterales bacterium]|nr:hypothetical protein [Bryobacterales bacterium]
MTSSEIDLTIAINSSALGILRALGADTARWSYRASGRVEAGQPLLKTPLTGGVDASINAPLTGVIKRWKDELSEPDTLAAIVRVSLGATQN